MNFIVFTHAAPQYLPTPIIDEAEIVCGPNYTNLRTDGRYRYIHTPRGGFEISTVLDKLPESQSPDIILIHADATFGCLPQNLPEGPQKVLLVGDTHHLKSPIRNLIAYAKGQAFTHVFLWNRQHAHFFKQAGLKNVFWMPGLTFHIPEVPALRERQHQLCFFGQVGPYHPRRRRILSELKTRKIPVVGGQLPRRDSLELAAHSTLSLNISLNGEWNLRIFESSNQGSLLITDRLSHKTGIQHFYPEGEALLSFSNLDELLSHIVQMSNDKAKLAKLAVKAKATTDSLFSFVSRKEIFGSLLKGAMDDTVFALLDEPRCRLPAVEQEDEASLVVRIQIYEYLQELHRQFEHVEVIHYPGVFPLILSDLSDLIRLKQTLVIDRSDWETNWQTAMKELEVLNLTQVDPGKANPAGKQLVLLGSQDLENPQIQQLVIHKKFAAFVIVDWAYCSSEALERSIIETGYTGQHDLVHGLFIKA